jgi:hypothetical protein
MTTWTIVAAERGVVADEEFYYVAVPTPLATNSSAARG